MVINSVAAERRAYDPSYTLVVMIMLLFLNINIDTINMINNSDTNKLMATDT